MNEYEAWKADQARAYAEKVRSGAMRVKALQCTVDSLRETYDGLGAVRYDRAGKSQRSNGDDTMANLVVRLDEAIEKYVEELRVHLGVVEDFIARCRSVDATSYSILVMRYCNGRTWQEVADGLGYSVTHVRGYAHTAALAALYDVMPHTERDPFPRSMNSEFLES